MKRVLVVMLVICISPVVFAASKRYEACVYDTISPTLSLKGSDPRYDIDASQEIKGQISYEFYQYEEQYRRPLPVLYIEFEGEVVDACPVDPFLEPVLQGESVNDGCIRIDKILGLRSRNNSCLGSTQHYREHLEDFKQ